MLIDKQRQTGRDRQVRDKDSIVLYFIVCARSLSVGQESRSFKLTCAVLAATVPKNVVAHQGDLFVLPVVHVFAQFCCYSLVSSHHCFGVFCSVSIVSIVFVPLACYWILHPPTLLLQQLVSLLVLWFTLLLPFSFSHLPCYWILHTPKPCFSN